MRSRWKKQTTPTGGMRAAVASILEIEVEEVPDVPGKIDEAFFKRFGLRALQLPGTSAPMVYHLAVGPSNSGGMHTIVRYGPDTVHDPHTGNVGLIECFAVYILVPIDVARIKYDE